MIHAQQIEEDKSKDMERSNKRFRIGSYSFSEAGSQGGNRSHHRRKTSVPTPSSASVPTLNLKDMSHDGSPDSKAHISVISECTYLLCGESGKNHLVACKADNQVCFGCGKPGDKVQECRVFAKKGRDPCQKGITLSTTSGQRQNRLYSLRTRHDPEGFPNIDLGML
ncbi:uncharacterized protein LOC124898418 [Capsicum annuum]|uniref:uncharacterized protein LOC124898418 n=1 Tax=Capsicum annuum TaxID=4072 RepID=UPI001FB0B8E2|nr:uncharacterized protein LOC124898418 [Capsicum annuum]